MFAEGRRLLDRGAVQKACEKFEASQRAEAAIGTTLNLADCRERAGQLAVAWAQFREAAALAARLRDDRRGAEARRRADRLLDRLGQLRIVLAPAPAATPPPIVRCDGERLDPALLDTAWPVMPGVHKIEAERPGHAPWVSEIVVNAGAEVRVEIPTSEVTPAPSMGAPVGAPAAPAGAPTAVAVAPAAARGVPRLAFWTGVAGLTALVAAGGFAASAAQRFDDVGGPCRREGTCTKGERDGHEAARFRADAATWLAAGGAAMVAVGGVVWWRAGRGARLTAQVTPSGLTASYKGSF